MSRGLIILDRDGVINEMVLHPEHGLIDSPMNPNEVQLVDGAAAAIVALNQAGFKVVIASNQPAAAKGKTTMPLLQSVHAQVLQELTQADAPIASSYICWHKSEDQCDCRKPKPGLLQAAIKDFGKAAQAGLWMVGDGITDVQAGAAVGATTVFLGPQKCDACKCFERRKITPDFWSPNLKQWVDAFLAGE